MNSDKEKMIKQVLDWEAKHLKEISDFLNKQEKDIKESRLIPETRSIFSFGPTKIEMLNKATERANEQAYRVLEMTIMYIRTILEDK